MCVENLFLLEMYTYRKRRRDRSSIPTWPHVWSWAILKSGAQSCFQVSHMGTGAKELGLSADVSQARCRDWLGSGAAGPGTGAFIECHAYRQRPGLLCHSAIPKIQVFFSFFFKICFLNWKIRYTEKRRDRKKDLLFDASLSKGL